MKQAETASLKLYCPGTIFLLPQKLSVIVPAAVAITYTTVSKFTKSNC